MIVTSPREAIRDLDRLPIPDRGLIDFDKYSRFIGLAMAPGCVSLLSSRGCPYRCAYCHNLWPKKHVFRSAENLFEEVQYFRRMGLRRFSIVDDIFNLNVSNSSSFLRMVAESKLDVELYFGNGLRGDILTPDYIDLLVEAGAVSVSLALESASPRLQRLIGKNLDLEKFARCVEYFATRHRNVMLDIFAMIGFPTETEAEAMATVEYLKGVRWLHFPQLYLLKIYPNTAMERLALDNGTSPEAIRESSAAAFHDVPSTLPFSKGFARKMQFLFYADYVLDPDRLRSVVPVQLRRMGEDELVQKYAGYLPVEVRGIRDVLAQARLGTDETARIVASARTSEPIPRVTEILRRDGSQRAAGEGAFRLLLLDLSQEVEDSRRDARSLMRDQVDQPLGLMYLMTYVLSRFPGRVVGRIAKARVDFEDLAELRRLIEEFRPSLIGIRTLSYYRRLFHRAVEEMRAWGVTSPIVAGGPYPTSSYDEVLANTGVNLAVLGEGELTLEHLIRTMLENGGALPDAETLKKIPGIAFRPAAGNGVGERSAIPGT